MPHDSGDIKLKERGNSKTDETRHDDSILNVFALFVLFLVMIFRASATLASQMGGGKVNIFEQNTIRYGVTFLIAFTLVITQSKSVFVEAKYIHKVVLVGALNFSTISIIFFSASFMPVGNIEAMYVGGYVFSTTVIDVCQRNVKFVSSLVSLLMLVGLISLSQPWDKMAENADIDKIPCDYWEENRMYNLTVGNISETETILYMFPNQEYRSTPNDSYRSKRNHNFIYIDGVKYDILINPIILGYTMIILAVVSGTIRTYFAKKLRSELESLTLTFWLAVIEGTLSVLSTVIWSSVNGVSMYSFPSGKICLTFVLAYGFFAGVLYIFWVYSAGKFNISKLALANVIVLLVLYICQRTFLKHFHPGKANLFETFGIIFIVSGLLLLPFCELISCLKKENK